MDNREIYEYCIENLKQQIIYADNYIEEIISSKQSRKLLLEFYENRLKECLNKK